jgi:hypothetical protein
VKQDGSALLASPAFMLHSSDDAGAETNRCLFTGC